MSDIKFNGVIYASSDSANITYKDTSVYNKLEELSAGGSIDGIIVNVEIGKWVAKGNVWTNTIAVEGISASDVYDISLYDDYSEEQANAYDFLITSIDTFNNQIVLTASEKIDVALSIILRGRVNLEDKNVFVSDLSATSIDYDNTKSGLDATNMQNAVDEIATMVNGLVVNVSANSWDLQEDGSYKKIIAIEQLTGNETLDVCLYPGDSHSEEQIIAFSELLSSIETYNGFIVLTAVEKINVSFRIFLYGKVNFDKNNLVALTDNVIEIIPISEEEFNKKSDAEKAAGNFLVDDGEDDDYLSARNIEFDGSETGLGDNVHDAISNLFNNIDNKSNVRYNVETDKVEIYFGGKWTAWGKAVGFVTHFIYNQGDQCTDLTGGWTSSGYSYTGYTFSGGKLNSSNMTLNGVGNSKGQVLGTVEPIDLTNYSTLNISVQSAQVDGDVACWISVIGSKVLAYTNKVSKTGSHTISVDISNKEGEFYIAFAAFNSGSRNVAINKVWLEH